MRKISLSIILALTAIAAQAGVFKCKTAEGFIYSGRPCPSGSISGNSQQFLDQRLASLDAGCSPYSVNGDVV